LFLLAGFSFCIKAETCIDPNTRQVVREGRLFGKYRIWRRVYPFAAFKTVAFRLYESTGENGTVRIGLRRQNGRIMEVCYFNVGPGPNSGRELRSDALNLSRAIGLPVEENGSSVAGPGR